MTAEPKPFLRIDETPTELENDRLVHGDQELQDHTRLIHAAFDLLPVTLRRAHHRNDDELAFLRLGIRLFNSAASSLKLARSGYYQPSLSMVRDIVEIQFLVDLFRRNPEGLRLWVRLSPRDRERRFKPYEIRKKLDDADGYSKSSDAAKRTSCSVSTLPTLLPKDLVSHRLRA